MKYILALDIGIASVGFGSDFMDICARNAMHKVI